MMIDCRANAVTLYIRYYNTNDTTKTWLAVGFQDCLIVQPCLRVKGYDDVLQVGKSQ